ncbi:hypothetical protein MBLNU457_5705t1 [Dothideomycetes sp. NU457]
MSNQIYNVELSALSSEAKRKYPDIRTAADKSLQDLKALPSTSEQQLAADLSRRPTFIEPFVLACASKNVRLAGSAIVCLQRLVISRGLPKSRLRDVLDAFNACTSLGLDIQLKILQALPALAQNYAEDLIGDLLAAALQVCAALQSVKAATISGVATATFQQLIVSVFERVAVEDAEARKSDIPAVAEVEGDDGPLPVREAAFDAYRIFLDIALAVDGRKTKFIELTNFSPTLGLELVGSCLNSHPRVFGAHAELAHILRTLVLPSVIRVLSDRESFPLTLRAMRILPQVFRLHIQNMPEECETILDLLTHILEPDSAAPWKRIMCMEVFKSVYAAPGLALQMYMQYDMQEGRKAIVRDNVSSFVRLSTERPALVGLGQQSTMPAGPVAHRDTGVEQATTEATGGVGGIMSTNLAVVETNVPGISSQWSIPKTQCMDYLDKSEPPPLPETYIYTLVLECLNSLSETLARVILPLTVRHETKSNDGQDDGQTLAEGDADQSKPQTGVKRSQSFRAKTVPLNPLTLDRIPAAPKVRAIADLVESCWPAILATSSTFLYAALDNDYYRSLIRSFQRFTQVAGLLQLKTARDAFLTTLAKAAVPPNLAGASSSSVPQSPVTDSPSIYNSAKGMLGVESNHRRRPSAQESSQLTLTTRNMLCLRALINLGIAIGPTLEESFSIVLDALQQADVILHHAFTHGGNAATSSALGTESAAVGAAALRFFESTADYPNDSFKHVLTALCKALDSIPEDPYAIQTPRTSQPSTPRLGHGWNAATTSNEGSLQPEARNLILSKVGQLADLNIARFASYSTTESGWRMLAEHLNSIGINSHIPRDSRSLATDIFSRCCVSLARMSASDNVDETENVQKMAVESLRYFVHELYGQSSNLSSTDMAVHGRILDAQKTILDTCGDSLVAGWDTVLSLIESVYQVEDGNELISLDLGKRAFAIIQLICSDFLAMIPRSSMGALIDLLYKFSTQDQDLNMSLTTITLFRDLSTHLEREAIPQVNQKAPDTPPENENSDSHSVLWLTLLSRLRNVISHDRADIRSGAFQTLMRLLSDLEFSADGWHLILSSVLFKILQDDVHKQQESRSSNDNKQAIIALDQTSKTLLAGIAELIANNMRTIEQTKKFSSDWSTLNQIFRDYLTLQTHVVNHAVYLTIYTVLSVVPAATDSWQAASSLVFDLWSSDVPSAQDETSGDAQQDAFVAYTSAATEIYRLKSAEFSAEQIETLATNLLRCCKISTAAAYCGDVNSMTRLQTRVMEFLRALRTDLDDVARRLTDVGSEIVALPFENHEDAKSSTGRPTFVAFSKAAMVWISELVIKHVGQPQMVESGSVARALRNLCRPIKIKYAWRQPGRQPPPWKQATSTALEIIPPVLKTILKSSNGTDLNTKIWREIINISSAVMSGNYSMLNVSGSYSDIVMVEEDEKFDLQSLTTLRDTIMPHLGSSSLPSELRNTYTRSLFLASIIHPQDPSDLPTDPTTTTITTIRFGRVEDREPSRREDLAYFCFAELISLVSATPVQLPYHASTWMTEPYTPALDYGDTTSDSRKNLAKAAAPWLVHRFALTLKDYIADQPLRGALPTPISVMEEILWSLERMKELRCLQGVVEGFDGDKAHLRILYPLLVKAVGVAGHRRSGDAGILRSLQGVLEVAGQR